MTHELPDHLSREARDIAAAFDVAAEIHPQDYIFQFVLKGATSDTAAAQDYYEGGGVAAAWLRKVIETFRPADEPFSLLEFAAGYGRVSRHIAKALPQARLVASDIHPAAVGFLRQIGIEGHQSSPSPQTFSVDRRFDVIFALSFFTHMPKATWTAWLQALLRHLEPGGCLVFTTHGVPGMKVMGSAHQRSLAFDEDGFWFAPMSEQEDIDVAEYGSTGTSLRFVHRTIEECGASLFAFQERGAGYQDVYIVRAAAPEDDRRGAVVRTARTVTPRRAAVRHVADAADCIFYHTWDVPGLGPVQGQWDLRGHESNCLGGVPLAGRSVLEIGPASGYLTFWMERQGARVTSFDLDDTEHWDLVPFAGLDPATIHATRGDAIRRVNNSWWYSRAATGSQAELFNGTAYDVDETLGLFDVVTINSVLLHLRDPLLAIERAAGRARHQIVITDVAERQFAPGAPPELGHCLHSIPRAAAGGPIDGWWYIPSTLVAEQLRILGFADIQIRDFELPFQDGNAWQFYTIVGTRA